MRYVLFLLLLLYTALLPFERLWDTLFNVDTVFKPYRIVGLLILPLWLLWMLSTGKRLKLDVGDKSYLLIFGWGVLMALFWNIVAENDLSHTGHAAQLILFGFAMYAFTKKLELTSREIEIVFVAYMVGFAASILWARGIESTSGRFQGLQNNPNQFGIAAGMGFVFLLSQFLYQVRPRLRSQLIRIAATITMLGLIGLSGSRGATLGTAVGASVLLTLTLRTPRGAGRRRSTPIARVLVFAALCGAVVVGGFDRFEAAWEQTESRTRFEEEFAVKTAGERWDIWRSGWNVGLDHFGMGSGMMQYLSHHVASIRKLPDVSNERLTRGKLGTHSTYVDLFACYGVVGLGAFIYYTQVLYRRLRDKLALPDEREERRHLVPLALALLTAMLTYIITMNSFSWCDYYMAMALIHTIAWRRPSTTSTAQLAEEPLPVGPVDTKQAPAFGRNQTLVHDQGRR